MGGVFNNLPEDQPVEFSLGSASLTLAIPELISTIGTGIPWPLASQLCVF